MQREQCQKRPLLRRAQLDRARRPPEPRAGRASGSRSAYRIVDPASHARQPLRAAHLARPDHLHAASRCHTHARRRRLVCHIGGASAGPASTVGPKATLTGPYLHTTAKGTGTATIQPRPATKACWKFTYNGIDPLNISDPRSATAARGLPQDVGVPIHGEDVLPAGRPSARPLGRPPRGRNGRRRSSRPAASRCDHRNRPLSERRHVGGVLQPPPDRTLHGLHVQPPCSSQTGLGDQGRDTPTVRKEVGSRRFRLRPEPSCENPRRPGRWVIPANARTETQCVGVRVGALVPSYSFVDRDGLEGRLLSWHSGIKSRRPAAPITKNHADRQPWHGWPNLARTFVRGTATFRSTISGLNVLLEVFFLHSAPGPEACANSSAQPRGQVPKND